MNRADGGRWSWPHAVAIAALVAGAVTATAAIAVALGIGDELRASVSDRAHTSADAHPDVVILAVDEGYLEELRTGFSTPDSMFSAVLRSEANTVVGDDGLFVAALTGAVDLGASPGEALELGASQIQAFANGSYVNTMADVDLDPPRANSRLPVVVERARRAINGPVGLPSAVVDQGQDVLRTVPLAAETEDDQPRVITSTSALAMRRLLGLAAEVQETSDGLRIADRFVPTEGEQHLRVSYSPELLPGGSQVVSAVDFHEYLKSAGLGPTFWGEVEPPFTDKIVFLGVTDPDVAPTVVTPAGPLPAVFVDANAANTLLTEQYLRPIEQWRIVVAAGALAFLVSLLTLTVPLWLAPLLALGIGGGWWFGTWALVERGWLGDPLFGLGVVAAAFFVSLGWRAASERRRRNEVAGLLSRYVPASVARDLMESGSLDDHLAGHRLDVTVLFCDVRGFTALSAELDPTEVRSMLDHYYEYASRLVLHHSGTLMQYVGDEVFAVFGTPIEDVLHPERGLACALALQRERCRLLDELERRGLPQISFGIGLNSGDVVAAHVGSSIRRQYSVTGYTVNVGARLCQAAGPDEILLSETFRAQAGDLPPLEGTGVLDLKGVSDGFEAWRVDPGVLATARGAVSP